MGERERAKEEVSMEFTTPATSSTVVATLGNDAASDNEILSTVKFAPTHSISEWTDEVQKTEYVTMILRRGLQEKHINKVTVVEYEKTKN